VIGVVLVSVLTILTIALGRSIAQDLERQEQEGGGFS